MNLFDFLYSCIKEGLFYNIPVIVIAVFALLLLLLPYYIVRRIKSLTIKKDGFEVTADASEKKSFFSFLRRKNKPSVMQKINKQHKEKWSFKGQAYNLGEGTDGRTYFIGYFGQGIPEGYKTIEAECETIVGVDWDNTPEWKPAFEAAKRNYQFNGNNAPDYTGIRIRNNRNLHGIYATNTEWKEALVNQ